MPTNHQLLARPSGREATSLRTERLTRQLSTCKQSVQEVKSKITVADFFRTSLNSTASPLLRLAAELRNQIWHLAFGEKMLYVRARRFLVNTKEQLDYTLYDSVDEQPIRGNPRHSAWTVTRAPQLVCRQYWAEASEAFFSSCALRVDEPTAFRGFVQFGGPIVSQICRLIVYLYQDFPLYWEDAFKSSLVGRLTSLEGLSFLGTVFWGPGLGSDVMSGWYWKIGKMPKIIRSFQQHQLKEKLTTVKFRPDSRMKDRAIVGLVNDAIRENLLRYHPLRRSKRRIQLSSGG